MAEPTSSDGQPTGAPTSGAGDEKQITMTPQQLAERLARAKPADYDELKAKAAKWDQAEAANKTELDKANDRAARAEQERDAARAEALRYKVAAAHGISTAAGADGTPSDAELFLTGTDEDTLTRQAERLTQRGSDRRTRGNVAPREGTNPHAEQDDLRQFARQLFRRNN